MAQHKKNRSQNLAVKTIAPISAARTFKAILFVVRVMAVAPPIIVTLTMKLWSAHESTI
jgi:hypothetical protein